MHGVGCNFTFTFCFKQIITLFRGTFDRQVCNRVDKIYTLEQESDAENYLEAQWSESSTLKLKKPKSSHNTLMVPWTFGNGCWKTHS